MASEKQELRNRVAEKVELCIYLHLRTVISGFYLKITHTQVVQNKPEKLITSVLEMRGTEKVFKNSNGTVSQIWSPVKCLLCIFLIEFRARFD